MMKKMLIFAAIAAMFFSSCSQDLNDENPGTVLTGDYAYLSIKVDARPQSRAGSDENPGLPAESTLKSLYILTFDDSGNIVGIPGSNRFYSVVEQGTLTQEQVKNPEPVKVSASAKNLVVIANPGTKLLVAVKNLNSLSTFKTFNAAIKDVTTAEIAGGNGFTMITGGDETTATAEKKILTPYVTIGTKIKVVGTDANADATAQAAAAADRLDVRLERLASKLVVKEKSGGATPTQAGATFVLNNWTVDAVNSTFYPFSVKTLIDATHTPGGVYTSNFYTEDTNYAGDTSNAGIIHGTVDSSFDSVLSWGESTNKNGYYGWIETADVDKNVAYVIENTMAAADQKVVNTTRLVLKAQYTPNGFTANADWFHFGGTDYKSLADLQKAYAESNASQELKDVCDAFHAKIQAYYEATEKAGFSAAGFAALTVDELAGVDNGGEVVKDGTNNVIRWYQKGLCYYYYEIRHNNDPNAGHMAFAKYGVVRNNWYNLTLNTVSGPGTPWYPDINNPGSGDPKPEDPIDDQAAYLGVTITIDPWIIWETGFDI